MLVPIELFLIATVGRKLYDHQHFESLQLRQLQNIAVLSLFMNISTHMAFSMQPTIWS